MSSTTIHHRSISSETKTDNANTFKFKPIQPWNSSTSTRSPSIQRANRQMSRMDISDESLVTERPMLSPPYGIEVPIDTALNMDTVDLYQSMQIEQHDFVSPRSYSPGAAYLPYRRYLVDWMSDVGEQCNLHNTTVHCSILYLDKIFRSNHIPREKWQLLATACISVAAKYEEAEEHCPPIPDLLALTKLRDVGHTSLSFRNEGELEVLRYLGWRMRAIPSLHVIGYYLSKGAIFVNDTWEDRPLIEKIPKYVRKYAEFFSNLTLQEYSFQAFLPTQLAAAIILASRVALHLCPRWRPELVLLTGYEEGDIIDCFNKVWSYYEEQFPGHGSRSISPRSVSQHDSQLQVSAHAQQYSRDCHQTHTYS